MLRVLTSVIAMCCVASAARAAGARPQVQPGAVGVAYLMTSDATSVTLRVVFPASSINAMPVVPKAGAKARIVAPLHLYDEQGELAALGNPRALPLVFWCENDRGVQYRGEVDVKVPLAKLSRRLSPLRELQDLVGFVVAGDQPEPTLELTAPGEGRVHTTLDLAADGKPDAYVYAYPDEAKNCDGKPNNQLVATLRTKEGNAALRCCGP